MGLYGAIRHVWTEGRIQSKDYRETETRVNVYRKPVRKFYTAVSLRETVEEAGLHVVELAARPVIAGSLGASIENARQDAEVWAYVVEMEKKACRVPGVLDAGQHIIAATERAQWMQNLRLHPLLGPCTGKRIEIAGAGECCKHARRSGDTRGRGTHNSTAGERERPRNSGR
jgi:hypothetical protein